MKNLLLLTTALALLAAPATAQAPAKPEPAKMAIRDCLAVLAGLQLLDGRKVIVAAGKATESVEVVSYKLPGKVRDVISHNLFVLDQVQREAQAANRRAQQEVGKGQTIAPGSREALLLDERLNEYLDRPCGVTLDHIRDSDLNLEQNDIPGTVLAAIWRIRDR